MRFRANRVSIGFFVDVAAGWVHVREDGPADAPTLVLIHGFASSLHWYDLLTPLLSDDYRVVRMDLLGTGCSPRDSARFDAETQAAMVLSVLDALGVEGFVPVGHSFGADVAIALAELSGRADRVVIIGQAPDYTTATLPLGHHVAGNVLLARILQALSWLSPPRRSGLGFAPKFRPDLAFPNPTQAGADLRAADPRTFSAVLVDRERSLHDRPLDVRLQQIGLPAMVILGAMDQFYPLAPTKARYDAVPGVRVEVIDASGHSPIVEAPDEVACLLRNFIAEPQNSGGAAV